MNLFARFFGKSAAVRPTARPSEFGPASQVMSGGSQYSRSAPTSGAGSRRELLRVVLRDSLRRHGIPSHWITADLLTATSRNREPGIHWRLSIRHWDERLPNLCVAFQNSLISRVQMFDPMAEHWLMGISWQFAIEDESPCPRMPHPGLWTAPVPTQAPPLLVDALPPDGDVIAGPVQIEATPADVKADLEKLMSTLDAQYQSGDASKARQYASTEPSPL